MRTVTAHDDPVQVMLQGCPCVFVKELFLSKLVVLCLTCFSPFSCRFWLHA